MSTPRRRWRPLARAGATFGAAVALALIPAGVAYAHVTAQPESVAKGGYAKIAFRVPTESATAGTVKLVVTLPADHPITSVRTSPIPGWTAQIDKAPLNPPVESGGKRISEAPRTITWTAQPGTRIGPTEFAEFDVSMGPLPSDTDQLSFPAAQYYDDGKVVNWDQPQAPGAEEPEHPAPTVKLVAGGGGHHDAAAAEHGSASATAGGHGSDSGAGSGGSGGGADNTARWLGGIGLVLGALGFGLGAGAVARVRRSGRSG
ncbi:YcnI family protein [Pseudonocardia acaciae]|uniref:YcnI family copper-binding membrane protein n=1 Tax=Pseudonocardia acaciae TaxID=551276 RepID=UPI00048B5D9E|nr:YcnI family protein [Pseudonocardia acaciae]